MFSYFLYNFILVGCFVFSYLAEKLNSKYLRLISRFIVFLFLTIPASLRYYTGADYGSYVKFFYNSQSLSKCEILWIFLNKIVIFLNLPVQFIFVFSAILIYYPICFKLKRKYYCLSIVLYIILFYYFKSYNILRQMIAVSFILWALIKFESKNYIKSLILYLIAIGFHNSAIILLPCFFVSFIKIKGKRLPFILLFLILILCLRFNFLNIMFSLLSKLGSRYSKYANSKKFMSQLKINSGLGVLSRLFFPIFAIIFYKKLKNKYSSNIYLLNFSYILILTTILGIKVIILGRIRELFIFVPLLLAGLVLEEFGKYRKIAMLLILSINLLQFEMDIRKSNKYNFSNIIYPYYSIFYEGEIK